MLKANYHTHTTFCDGDETAERMVQRALELEFGHLGFSGHTSIFSVAWSSTRSMTPTAAPAPST